MHRINSNSKLDRVKREASVSCKTQNVILFLYPATWFNFHIQAPIFLTQTRGTKRENFHILKSASELHEYLECQLHCRHLLAIDGCVEKLLMNQNTKKKRGGEIRLYNLETKRSELGDAETLFCSSWRARSAFV